MVQDGIKSAKQRALKALGRRMHTTWEIRESLTRRGFGDDVVKNVVAELVRQGYLDDRQFTRTWIQSRSLHQFHGRLRLLRDLRQKGIPEEIAESVLEESLPEEDEVVIAVKAIEKKRRTLRATGIKGRDALYRHLRSRGFTARVIGLAMAGSTFEEDSP